VQAIGEKGEVSMKKTVHYTNEPIGDIKVIKDFLLSPKDLVLQDENVKVTISLTKCSIISYMEHSMCLFGLYYAFHIEKYGTRKNIATLRGFSKNKSKNTKG
jgi:hypothetical protein